MSDNNNQQQQQPAPARQGHRRGGRIGGGPPGMRGVVEKPKNFKGTFARLVQLLAPQRHKFLAVLILAVFSTSFSIAGPKILGKATTKIGDGVAARIVYVYRVIMAHNSGQPQSVIDSLLHQNIPLFDFGYINRIMLLMIGLYLFSSLLSFAMAYIMSDVSQLTVFNMRQQVKEKLDRLPLKYFDTRTHGEILSRVTNDMDTIANTLQQSLTQFITSAVTIVGIFIMMLTISPLLTLIGVLVVPASAVISMVIVKNSQKFYASQQKFIGQINGHVEEMYTGHKAVKVFSHEEEAIKTFDESNKQLHSVGWKAQFISGIIFPALNFVSNIGYVMVCIIGGVLVARHTLKIGDVQSFIQYLRNFTQPIVQTASIANTVQSTIAAAERVFEILDEEEEIPDAADAAELGKVQGLVNFEHVRFGYTPDKTLITDMNIDVKSGQTIAIVGPTGAGKTTLINLLMRFYEIQGGTIRVDGVDITRLKRGSLRKSFGMVLQDTWLFNGTIYDNIRYGNENATEDQVKDAAKAALAHRFIRTLPEGYNTVLNEEASNISQGQKQLLTIARAILADPDILILDEATSNVDTRTEVMIQKAMDALMEGRTSFVIAHRLSTIRNANTIIVMNHGDVIEHGSHSELMAAKGFYADLYNSQFSGRNPLAALEPED